MRKITYLLFVVFLGATLQAAELETLKVDFGTTGSDVESGYEAYQATNEQEATFTTQSYSVFGTTVSVTPTWEPDAVAAVRQMFDRSPNTDGKYIPTTTMEYLTVDWIGSDTRSVGDPLTLTISGLPEGEYTWVSYHHDAGTDAGIGTFDVTVNDATGLVTTLDNPGTDNHTTQFADIATFETTVTSNGVDDITLVFDNQNPDGTTSWNESWFCMNGFDLTMNFIRGGATDPVPSGLEVDSQTTTAVSWTAPVDPNIVSITGYDVVFGTDPNMLLNPVYSVATESLPLDGPGNGNPAPLTFATTYYWRVDTHVEWDSIEVTGVINDTATGFDWNFTTLPDDLIPIVAGNDVLTSIDLPPANLTGTVDDFGEDDIASIAWGVIGTDAPNTAMQMTSRNGENALANLAEVAGDPNLLMDWIGTDTREAGNPMVLTLKGLPNGTYTWKSYHHDPDVTVTGMFDVTVIDASGSTVTSDIEIGDSNSLPIGTFPASGSPSPVSITANGTDDVILIFDLHPYAGLGYNDAWFVMNGFELTDGVSVDPLFVDFGLVGVAPMPGYEAYEAAHEDTTSFTEQIYSAFGTTVSVLPTWGGYATVTDTTNDPSSSSQTATLITDWPASYTVQLSATDNASQTGSNTMVVTVAANNCAAAQLSSSWTGFNSYDYNEDCAVDIDDLALFASEWLDNRKLPGQE